MPGQFTPPTLQGSIKKQTVNFGFQIPRFDAPGWGLALEENWDTVDAVLYAFSGITNVKGDWQNSTLYRVAERVVDVTTNTLWQCYVEHTSAVSGTFLEDRTLHPTFWAQVTGAGVPRGQWVTNTNYNTGEYVTDAGRTGLVTIRYTSGASYNADVAAGKIVTVVDVSSFIDYVTAINTAPNKPTLIDADLFGIINKAGVAVAGNHSWVQLKAGIKAFTDPFYQPLRTVLTNTTASFLIADETKLDGIEALADVTDLTNVTAALATIANDASIADTDHFVGLAGVASTKWTWALIKSLIQTFLTDLLVKPGTIVMTGRSTPDAGYVECNGAAYTRTGSTAALFAAISTTWGVGNGSTTFNVPDFRGAFVRGWDHGRGLDPARVLASFQGSGIESHAHGLVMNAVGPHNHTYGAVPGAHGLNGTSYPSNQPRFSSGDTQRDSYSITVSDAGGHTPTGTVTATGGSETRPHNYSVMYQIKL